MNRVDHQAACRWMDRVRRALERLGVPADVSCRTRSGLAEGLHGSTVIVSAELDLAQAARLTAALEGVE